LGLRPSVAATLVLGFGALVVIAVGAVFLITLGIAEVNTRELLRASARQHVDAVVASVSVTLAPARAQAEFLARLIGSGEIDPRDDERLQTVLLGALAAAPQTSGVAFIRTDLSMVRATRTLSSFDSKSAPVQDRTDARKVLAEAERSAGPKWGDILYVPELGDTQITLYAPVRRGNRFLGAIVSVVSIANLSRTTRFCGMLKSSMFVEMPLDNRTVVQFTVQTAITGFRGPLKVRQGRNDLKFRRDWQFCNIEPKICQYD